MQNISKEDYLSVIYKNKDVKGVIKANIIADKLQISNAAVTDMLKKLSKDGYIKYERYRGINLTKVKLMLKIWFVDTGYGKYSLTRL